MASDTTAKSQQQLIIDDVPLNSLPEQQNRNETLSPYEEDDFRNSQRQYNTYQTYETAEPN